MVYGYFFFLWKDLWGENGVEYSVVIKFFIWKNICLYILYMFMWIIVYMFCVVIGILGCSFVVNGDKMILIFLKFIECVLVL